MEGARPIAASRSYRLAATDIPPEIARPLSRLRRRLGSRTLLAPLHVDPALASLPWEALLTIATAETESQQSTEWFRFWRTGTIQLAEVARVDPALEKPRVISLGNPVWSLMVEQGWLPLSASPALGSHISDVAQSAAGSIAVLHLIGNPIRTAAGLRLQIQRGRASEPSSSRQNLKAGGREREILIGAENLPLDRVGLVVVQAEPAETTERFDPDREQAAHLRALAAELFRAGAFAVIMLPALPSQLGARALARIAEALVDSSPTDLDSLLRAARDARAVIAAGTPSSATGGAAVKRPLESVEGMPPETRLELALDVTLFVYQPSIAVAGENQ
jgi:hypothetical protein